MDFVTKQTTRYLVVSNTRGINSPWINPYRPCGRNTSILHLAPWFLNRVVEHRNQNKLGHEQKYSCVYNRLPLFYTAKTLYRKFEVNIPRHETARPRSPIPTFMYNCTCERFIYFQDRSTYFACRAVSLLGIHKSDRLYSVIYLLWTKLLPC